MNGNKHSNVSSQSPPILFSGQVTVDAETVFVPVAPGGVNALEALIPPWRRIVALAWADPGTPFTLLVWQHRTSFLTGGGPLVRHTAHASVADAISTRHVATCDEITYGRYAMFQIGKDDPEQDDFVADVFLRLMPIAN